LNIFIRSKNIRRRSLKSSEIGQILRVWPLKIFGKKSSEIPKSLTLILRLNALPITIQNFAAIGRRSSEISRPGKKRKESVPFSGGLIIKTPIFCRFKVVQGHQCWCPFKSLFSSSCYGKQQIYVYLQLFLSAKAATAFSAS